MAERQGGAVWEGAAAPSAGEVFRIFLHLGLSSFGGPVAHLGYFREAFVCRRRWLDAQAYADLVAPWQFLPGPAGSPVGTGIRDRTSPHLRHSHASASSITGAT